MAKKTNKNNRVAFWLAMVSSLLLFLSGTTGVSSLLKLEEVVLRYADFMWLNHLFVLLLVIASFGGFTVFFGGLLILRERVVLGRLLIVLGSGAGILGFILNILISNVSLNLSIYSFLSYSSLGVVFALSAQFVSRRKRKKKAWFKKIFRKLKNI